MGWQPGRAMRFAGDLAAVGVMGAGGASLADDLAHSEMDYLAQDLKNLQGQVNAAPQEVEAAYIQVFGQGPMSDIDRIVATGVLRGADWASQGPLKADSPSGKKAFALAQQIQAANPQLAQQLAEIAETENDLFAKEALYGVNSGDVIAAANAGAGVSPVPAAVGGLALGGGMAALLAAAKRKGADPYRIPRPV